MRCTAILIVGLLLYYRTALVALGIPNSIVIIAGLAVALSEEFVSNSLAGGDLQIRAGILHIFKAVMASIPLFGYVYFWGVYMVPPIYKTYQSGREYFAYFEMVLTMMPLVIITLIIRKIAMLFNNQEGK